MKHQKAYRLVQKKWADLALTGEGEKRYGGRWNSKGNSCLYTASCESLAILEILVHLEEPSILQHYLLFEISIPLKKITILPNQDLPNHWQEQPAPQETADLGDFWLQQNNTVALGVPSVIVPREQNILLNPRHRDFSAITQTAVELPFSPDPRLS